MEKLKFVYSNFEHRDENCIVTTYKQLEKLTGLSWRTFQRHFKNNKNNNNQKKYFYDRNGKWKIEKIPFYNKVDF